MPTNMPIGVEWGGPAGRAAVPACVVTEILARFQDVKTACRAVVEYREHAAISGTPEGNETLLGPLRAAAVTAEAGSSGKG
jgi:hypothetical protein